LTTTSAGTRGLELLDRLEAQSVNGYPRHSVEEFGRRQRFIEDLIEANDLDAVVVAGSKGTDSPIQFFTNWPPRRLCYYVTTRGNEGQLLVRLRNHLPLAKVIAATDAVEYGGHVHSDMLVELGKRVGAVAAPRKRVGVIGLIPYGDMARLRSELPGREFVNLSAQYAAFRSVKSTEELDYVRVAAYYCDRAVEALHSQMRPGLPEYALEGIIRESFSGTRLQPVINFVTSSPMSAPTGSVPRQSLSGRVLEAGDVLVTEISVSYWGYTSQILRTLVLADEPSPEVSRLHEQAMRSYTELTAAMRPGVTVGELLDVADGIQAAGYTIVDDLIHGFGGGGYLSPVLRTRQTGGADVDEQVALPEGSIFVVQPNVCRPDESFGVQTGNAMLLTGGGTEVLQQYPTEVLLAR
jgi:Xaa-Pro dipeptidase